MTHPIKKRIHTELFFDGRVSPLYWENSDKQFAQEKKTEKWHSLIGGMHIGF